MRILALVPARGGSKGIPRKNIKLLAGKPLIAWTIEAALRSRALAAVVVSTDDEEIAEVAKSLGAQVPFLRPSALARDDSPGIDPVLHAVDQLPHFDAVLLLQATSPLRTSDDIDACIALANEMSAPSVVSVTEPAQHPHWMYRIEPDLRLQRLINGPSITRRQDLPPVYSINGALYYAEVKWLRRHRALVTDETIGYLMAPERSVDLDSLLDWSLAECLITAKLR